VDAVDAGARAARVGVVDGEALLLDGVEEVDGGAGQVGGAHPVGDDLDAAVGLDDVTLERTVVEVQLVAQSRTAAGLHGDAQREVVAPLAVEQSLDLGRGLVGENDALGDGALSGGGHPMVLTMSVHCTDAGERLVVDLNAPVPGVCSHVAAV